MTIHLIDPYLRSKTRCGLYAADVTTLNGVPTYPPHLSELCPNCEGVAQPFDRAVIYRCDPATFAKLQRVHSVLSIQASLTAEQRDEVVAELGNVINRFSKEAR